MDHCDNCSRLAMELAEAKMRIAILEQALAMSSRTPLWQGVEDVDRGDNGRNPDS